MKAAAIYARVSTSDQVKGTSLDGQVEACREYARQQGYSIIEAGVVTEDISGTVLNRPGLSRLMELAQRKEIDTVILAKVDRLARGRVVDALLETDLRTLGVDVLYVNRDTATPEGRLLVNIEKDFAEWERERIMERTWGGKLDRAKQGKVMGSRIAPYGYTHTAEKGGYQILESEAEWVRRMFAWLANERCSLGEIVRRLNSLGAPTKLGRPYWERGTMRAILSNSLYCGDWCWGKTQAAAPRKPRKEVCTRGPKSSQVARPREEWIHIPVPAIISREMYEAAQRQLQRNKELAGRPTSRKDLLKGMLSCSFCGRRLIGNKVVGRTYVQYVCTGHRTHGLREICQCPYLTAHKVERELWAKITRYLTNEDDLMALLRAHETDRAQEGRHDQAQLEALIEDESAIKRERNELLDLYLAEPRLIDRETFQERTLQLDRRAKEKQAARAVIEDRMRQRVIPAVSEDTIRENCAAARAALPELADDDKREWLELFNLRGIVYAKRIDFTWELKVPIIVPLSKAAETEDAKLYTAC